MRCTARLTGRPKAERDRGAASVLVIGIVAALLLLTAGAMSLTAAVAASHRARLAADLAAIAGAMRLREAMNPGAACAAASTTAGRNSARMVACRVQGEDLNVTVHVDAPRWPIPALARARAGPARS